MIRRIRRQDFYLRVFRLQPRNHYCPGFVRRRMAHDEQVAMLLLSVQYNFGGLIPNRGDNFISLMPQQFSPRKKSILIVSNLKHHPLGRPLTAAGGVEQSDDLARRAVQGEAFISSSFLRFLAASGERSRVRALRRATSHPDSASARRDRTPALMGPSSCRVRSPPCTCGGRGLSRALFIARHPSSQSANEITAVLPS
jgi:hypothetical protein